MAPSVVFSRNKPCGIRMAVGGSGGKKVPAAVAQVISNTLQYGLDVDKAIQSARAYADLLENKVYIEGAILLFIATTVNLVNPDNLD